jgi:MinD superfamily P-loop ATPase
MRFYVDGVLAADTNEGHYHTPGGGSDVFYVGGDRWGNEAAYLIDSLQIFDRPFDGDQVGALAVIPGKQVLVFDDMCIGCGACLLVCPNKAIYEIQRSQGVVEIADTPYGTLITGRVRVGTHSPVRVIDEAMKAVSGDEDVVIVDSPPGAADAMVHAVRDADFVVLVAEPTRFSTHDVGVVIDALKALGKPMGVVVNKAGIGDGGLQEMLGRKGVDVLLEIPFSKAAAQAVARGGTLLDVFEDLPGQLNEAFDRIRESI